MGSLEARFHGISSGLVYLILTRKLCFERLSKQFSCFAFDRPGFGLSSRPDSVKDLRVNPYHVEFTIQFLRHIFDKEGLKKIVLVSHSSGAASSLEFFNQHSELVFGMVFVSPSSGLPKFARTMMKTKLGISLSFPDLTLQFVLLFCSF
jgi:pimeloyl-ACP methyl ester carboxylesterase